MRIRIKETPEGPAPFNIRARWVGCILPVSGKEHDTYQVSAGDALDALARRDRRAFTYWSAIMPRAASNHHLFAAEICELLPS